MPKKKSKVWKVAGSITLAIFVFSLFILIWNFISENVKIILAIAGGLLTLFTITGVVTFKRIKKRTKKSFRELIGL